MNFDDWWKKHSGDMPIEIKISDVRAAWNAASHYEQAANHTHRCLDCGYKYTPRIHEDEGCPMCA